MRGSRFLFFYMSYLFFLKLWKGGNGGVLFYFVLIVLGYVEEIFI